MQSFQMLSIYFLFIPTNERQGTSLQFECHFRTSMYHIIGKHLRRIYIELQTWAGVPEPHNDKGNVKIIYFHRIEMMIDFFICSVLADC